MNLPVRVLSPGNDGSVDQSNKVDSKADASNHNSTTQTSDQDQSGSGGCGCASDPIQVAAAVQREPPGRVCALGR